MKKWLKYPVTIRASILGASITSIGAILLAIFTNVFKSNEKVSSNIIYTNSINNDSIFITERVESYYKYDSIKVKKMTRYDLDNNGFNNEVFIIYQLSNEKYSYFFDVFTIRDSIIHGLYHEEYLCDCIDYDYLKGPESNYFIKYWKDGSGGYLSLEIYKYSDYTRLTKIYSFPDTLNTFQGNYLRVDDKIYLILANKRYNLKLKSDDNFALVPYTQRLNTADMQNSEHILRFDEINHALKISFNDKRLKFEKSKADLETWITNDTIQLNINDICWLDDNSISPTGLRFFGDPHFQQNFNLFDNFIAIKQGIFTYDFINEGYGDNYRLVFNIVDNHRNLK